MKDERPLKVAQIVGSMNSGGVEGVVMNYYRHIDRDKIQFDFIVLDNSKHIPRAEIESLGGRIYIVPTYKHFFSYIKNLKKIIKENDYKVVHSHVNALSVFPLYAAKKVGVKIRIAHSHSTTNKKERGRNFIKNILRLFSKKYATHYFACSEFAGRWLFGDKTFDKGLVTVINNAIELEKYKFNADIRNKLRAQYGLTNQFVIGHIGRFMSQKNHTFLIDIFNEVQKRRSDAKLILIGDGPLYNEIAEKVEQLGLTDKVVFTGVRSDAGEYYNAMDVFVLPSLYEGLPVVGIEAQANGLKCYFSSEMTKETKVLDTAEFLSISDGSSEWVEKISHDVPVDRLQGYIVLANSKYNIITEATKLNHIYEELVNKTNGGGEYSVMLFTSIPVEQYRCFNLKESLVIGHIGRFMKQKNHDFIIDVFDKIKKLWPEARLLLVGDGPLFDEIKEKVNSLGLEDSVVFTGVKQNAYDYYNAMDVFVLPSLYEGFGIVLIEAQANGLPCVVSTEVPEEVNIANQVDFLELSDSVESWASHIVNLDTEINRDAYFYKIKNSAFDIEIEAQKLADKYMEILSN